MNFIDKQLALKLKEKGYDRPCFGEYRHGHDNFIPFLTDGNQSFEELLQYSWFIPAPTIEQVIKWLREKKKIHISIDVLSSMNKNFMCKQEPRLIFDVRVAYFKEEIFNYHELAEPYFKYDDACIAGIEYIINNNLI
jgi:hypothetical protein